MVGGKENMLPVPPAVLPPHQPGRHVVPATFLGKEFTLCHLARVCTVCQTWPWNGSPGRGLWDPVVQAEFKGRAISRVNGNVGKLTHPHETLSIPLNCCLSGKHGGMFWAGRGPTAAPDPPPVQFKHAKSSLPLQCCRHGEGFQPGSP